MTKSINPFLTEEREKRKERKGKKPKANKKDPQKSFGFSLIFSCLLCSVFFGSSSILEQTPTPFQREREREREMEEKTNKQRDPWPTGFFDCCSGFNFFFFFFYVFVFFNILLKERGEAQ